MPGRGVSFRQRAAAALDAVGAWRFDLVTAAGKPVPLLSVLGLSLGSGAGPAR